MDYWPRIQRLVNDFNALYQRVVVLEQQIRTLSQSQSQIWSR